MERILELSRRGPAECGDEPALPRGDAIEEAQPPLQLGVAQREVEREVAGERGDRDVVAGLEPRVHQVCRREAQDEAENEIPAAGASGGGLGAAPYHEREHALDGQAEPEVDPEEEPRLRGQQGGGQDAEVVAVLREDEAVERQEAGRRAGQHHRHRHHHARPREQQDERDHQQEDRQVGEHRDVADVAERSVDPGHRRGEPHVEPQVAQADEAEQARVRRGEPVRPAQQPAPRGHRARPTAPRPRCCSASRAISRAPASTLRPKLKAHSSRSATPCLRKVSASRRRSAT